MIIEGEDGVTHINIYSKGKTEIGRWLSNFTRCTIHTEDGKFESIEGYWYWLSTRDERFRTLYGWDAKKLGKETTAEKVALPEDVFQEKIRAAIDYKLKRRIMKVSEINLPLCHYYEYGDKRIDAGYEWIVEHIEFRIKQLKEHFN